MHLPASTLDVDAINVPLRTAGLLLEPVQARHAALLYDGMREPALYEWISMPPPEDLESLATRWGRLAERARRPPGEVVWLAWAVQRVADGAWIGELDVELTPAGVATNVGYFFFPAYWGRGHASEAVAALCDHLAGHGVGEQVAAVTRGNEASCRVLERAGFVRGRVLPGNDTIRGVAVDDLEFIRRG
jgi:ribosomal-protein-alanine N-acetyltransferase